MKWVARDGSLHLEIVEVELLDGRCWEWTVYLVEPDGSLTPTPTGGRAESASEAMRQIEQWLATRKGR